jgi:Acetyltransferase (GNAT) domain
MKEFQLSQAWRRSRVGEMDIEVIRPAPRREWLEISREDPHTLVSQTPAWIDSITRSPMYRDASRLYVLPSGRKLVLPMVERFGFLPWLSVLESPPSGWGIGGLLAPGGVTTQDISTVLADLSNQSFLYAAIRPNPLDGDHWAASSPEGMVKIPRVAHVLDLEGGFSQVWSKRFESAARQNIRHAERAGLDIECDTSGRLAPVFYKLFKQSIERWATQQHEPVWLARLRNQSRDPLGKFKTIADVLGENSRFWIAFLNGQPVAGILVLQGDNAYYTRGAMDKDIAGRTRANYLLHSLAIEDACRSGCRYYQMGETGESPTLARFKQRFGSVPHAYAEYRLERLPVTSINHSARQLVKKMIGFKDV